MSPHRTTTSASQRSPVAALVAAFLVVLIVAIAGPGAGVAATQSDDQGPPGEGMPGEATPDEGMPGEATPDEGTPSEAAPDEGTPGETDGVVVDEEPGAQGNDPAAPAAQEDGVQEDGAQGSAASSSKLLTLVGMQLRFLLYVAITLAAGSLFWLAVRIGSNEVRLAVRHHATSLLRVSVVGIGVVGIGRAVVATWTGLAAFPSLDANLVLLVVAGAPVWAWLTVSVAAYVAWTVTATSAVAPSSSAPLDTPPGSDNPVTSGDDPATSHGSYETLPAGWWLSAGLVVMVSFLAASVSHAITGPIPVASMFFGALHIGAAALWVGPLAVWALLRFRPYWAELHVVARSKALVEPLRAYSSVALLAALALTISGVRSAFAYSNGLPSGTYLTLILVKVGIAAAVVVPLGFYHFRNLSRRGAPRPARFLGTTFNRSASVELAAFVIILAVAAVLSTTTP